MGSKAKHVGTIVVHVYQTQGISYLVYLMSCIYIGPIMGDTRGFNIYMIFFQSIILYF